MKSLNHIAKAALGRLFKPGTVLNETKELCETTVTTVTMSESPFEDLTVRLMDWAEKKDISPDHITFYNFWSIELGLVDMNSNSYRDIPFVADQSIIGFFIAIIKPRINQLENRFKDISFLVPSHFIVLESEARFDMLDFAPYTQLRDYSEEYTIYPLSDKQKKDIKEKIESLLVD